MVRDILVQTAAGIRQLVVRKGQASLWQHEVGSSVLVGHHDPQGQRYFVHSEVIHVDAGEVIAADPVLVESLADFFDPSKAAHGVASLGVLQRSVPTRQCFAAQHT